MHFDYQSPDNHITRRDGIPPAIKPTLLAIPRDQWTSHPRFRGNASFLRAIHRDLLHGAAELSRTLEGMLDTPESELADRVAKSRLVGLGEQLISFAHHHHEIEDHHYFPQFGRLYPNLDRALALLDGDHRVLKSSLDVTHAALKKVPGEDVARDQIAALHRGSRALDAILRRHIADEEDIVIPILLKHT